MTNFNTYLVFCISKNQSIIMKKLLFTIAFIISTISLFAQKPTHNGGKLNIPKQFEKLYAEVLAADSVLFTGYNTHNIELIKKGFSKDLEFYHDKGGLSNYEFNIQALAGVFKQSSDIYRQLLRETVEIFPIANYGAVQTGLHRFCHVENGKDDCGTFKFVTVWKRTENGMEATRIISYDH